MLSRRLAILFIVLHLAVLAGGRDEYFWPLLNYSMFADPQRFAHHQVVKIEAVDLQGAIIPVGSLNKIIHPFPSTRALNNALKRRTWPQTCAYLKDLLRAHQQVGSFSVKFGPSLLNLINNVKVVDGNSDC